SFARRLAPWLVTRRPGSSIRLTMSAWQQAALGLAALLVLSTETAPPLGVSSRSHEETESP
ncbi:MAG TPA: hypothetical protein VM925_30800, partial [Labilithrix sp.]|nr:hypothetical protein [Labilithrix sp.]